MGPLRQPCGWNLAVVLVADGEGGDIPDKYFSLGLRPVGKGVDILPGHKAQHQRCGPTHGLHSQAEEGPATRTITRRHDTHPRYGIRACGEQERTGARFSRGLHLLAGNTAHGRTDEPHGNPELVGTGQPVIHPHLGLRHCTQGSPHRQHDNREQGQHHQQL